MRSTINRTNQQATIVSNTADPIVNQPNNDQVDLAGATDIGKARAENQDHFLIADMQRLLSIRDCSVPHDDCHRLFGSKPGRLLVVADGMGGHASGELASSTAIESCARYVLDMMQWFIKLSADNEDDFLSELSDCLAVIQRRLWSKGEDQTNRMGTTVTMAYVVFPRMYVVHAGDSRCYLYRDGELRQLTTDHTFAQSLVDDGTLSKHEAETSRWRHVLWNCVGGSDKAVQPEVCKVDLRESDSVLLCSDGLTGMVGDDQIKQVLEQHDRAGAAVEQLVRLANDAGGKDNITIVLGRNLLPAESDVADEECFGESLVETKPLENSSDA